MCRPGGKFTYRFHRGPSFRVEVRAVPLKSVHVAATIKDFSASVTVTQRFVNVEENPIEATYQFPMNEENAIVDFTCEIGGRKLKGTCKEKEEAKNTYDDAIAEGHGAYLLEQEVDKPEFFTVSVGNLPPGQEVLVHITYVTELQFFEKTLTWVLASTREDLKDPYSPYYRGGPWGEKFEIPKLGLTVNLEMTSNIRKVTSTTHPITFEFGEEPNMGTVTLSQDYDINLAKDFELSVVLAQPHDACSHVQQDADGSKVVAVSLFPDLTLDEDADVHTELIFIIDRSGSMSGSRINQVKSTMQIFLRSLAQGVMFQILGFGTDTEPLFKKKGKGKDMYKDFSTTVEYNDANLETATKHVNTLRANLGGTDILKALTEVLSQPAQPGYSRQIFLLTDGEVNNTEECIKYVRQHARTTRVFTFGIGKEASPKLVKGLAKAGEGRYEFVGDGGGMEEKVLRQLNRAMRPAITELAITWQGVPVHQTPHVLAPVFDGGRVTFFGFVQKGGDSQGQVTLTGKVENKPFSTSVPINLEKLTPGALFLQLAARSMIRDLEDGRSYMHDAKGELTVSTGELKEEVVRLSTKSGVLSKYTAFVAVEEREEATEGSMQSRDVMALIQKGGVEYIPTPGYAPSSITYNSFDLSKMILGSVPLSPPCSSSSAPIPLPEGLSFQQAAPPARSLHFNQKGGGGGEQRKRKKKSGVVKLSSISSLKKESQKDGLVRASECCEKDLEADFSSELLDECDEYGQEAEEEARMESVSKRRGSRGEGGGGGGSFDDIPPPATPAFSPPPAPATVSAAPPSDMKDIIMKQKATGSWSLQHAQTALTKISLEELKKSVPVVEGVAASELETLWATALVIAYLASAFPDQKVNWELVVKKAKTFLSRQSKKLGITTVDWEDEATKFVSSH